MTILRQGRWLRTALPSASAFSFTSAAVLGAGLLLPCSAFAASHTHHPLAPGFRATAVTDTGSHGASKHGKGAARGKANARSAGASAAPEGRRSTRKSKGRRQAEPASDPIQMYRAQRGPAPLVHGGAHAAGTHAGRHDVHGRFTNHPAPLVHTAHWSGHGEPGHPSLAEVANREARESRRIVPSSRANARTAPAISHGASASRPVEVASRERAPFAASPVIHSEVYAEGVSRPDADERLPRSRAAAVDTSAEDAETSPLRSSAASAPVATAHVSAAPAVPSRGSAAAPSQPAVVQGFGGEIAVPSGNTGERPGGTHRRNHPSAWSPEAMAAPPEPLEEREAITEAAVRPAVLPEIYDRNGRLLMPAPLKGSHDVLVHQNLMADNDGLDRIVDDVDLDRMRAAHLLVSFPASEGLRINEALPYNRRVARPWTVTFADDTARAFFAHFREPLVVTSAVRTVHYQAHLQLVNGNAAATYGDAASPHLTGQAIDIGKRGMSHAELAWMRGYLLPLMRSGKIDVEEEFHQACFHISVYRNYAAGRQLPRHEVAQARPVPVQPDEASEAQDVE